MKMAKSSPQEMEKMLQFFQGLEDICEGEFEWDGFSDYEDSQQGAVGKHVMKWWGFLNPSWQRFYWGFLTLLENVADPELDYLEWKPDVKRKIDTHGYLLAACQAARADYENITYPTERHQEVIQLLDTAIEKAQPVKGDK